MYRYEVKCYQNGREPYFENAKTLAKARKLATELLGQCKIPPLKQVGSIYRNDYVELVHPAFGTDAYVSIDRRSRC